MGKHSACQIYRRKSCEKIFTLIFSPISYFPLLFHKCRFTCALSGFLLSIPFPISMDLLNFVANQKVCVKLFTKFALAKTFDYFHVWPLLPYIRHFYSRLTTLLGRQKNVERFLKNHNFQCLSLSVWAGWARGLEFTRESREFQRKANLCPGSAPVSSSLKRFWLPQR